LPTLPDVPRCGPSSSGLSCGSARPSSSSNKSIRSCHNCWTGPLSRGQTCSMVWSWVGGWQQHPECERKSGTCLAFIGHP
jgi:hypothetical protein